MNIKTKKAFTLIELIVVITILSILWTISFITLNWYAASARNSKRTVDMKNMKNSLELVSYETWKYPLPDNGWAVSYSWELLWTQGIFWETVTKKVTRIITKQPLDPLLEVPYLYSVTNNRKEYQILWFFENDVINDISFVNNTYASSKKLKPKVAWTYNKLYIQSDKYLVPTPSIMTSEELPLDFQSDAETIKSQIITWWMNFPNINVSWIETITWSLNMTLNPFLLITDESTSLDKIAAIDAIQATYSWTILADEGIYRDVLATSDKLALADVMLLNNTQSITYNMCDWVPHNTTKSFYESESVSYWLFCSSVKKDFKCVDWTWKDWNVIADTATYQYETCSTNWSLDCTILWNPVIHWENLTVYSEENIAWDAVYNCANREWIITCNNWVWEWDTWFWYTSCSKWTPPNCVADSNFPYNSHTYNVSQLDHWNSENIWTNITENNWVFRYTLNASCNGWTIIWNSETWPVIQSCTTWYHINGNICEIDACITPSEASNLNNNLWENHTAWEWCNLTTLGLFNKWLYALPNELFKLTNLEEIYLDNNDLNWISSDITNLINLRELTLNDNQFNDFPAELINLPSLRILRLSDNNISLLPDDITNLTDLEELNLDGNMWLGILSNYFHSNSQPETQSNVTYDWTAITISWNGVSIVISEWVSCELEQFEVDELNSTFWEFYTISEWCELEDLDWSNKNIDFLSNSITKLPNLMTLNLDNNNLTDLPFEMLNLINLKFLYLSINDFIFIPDGILNLTNLEKLYLNDNNLTKLPNDLVNLTNLTDFNIGDNLWLGELNISFYNSSSPKTQSDITPDWKSMTISWNWSNIMFNICEDGYKYEWGSCIIDPLQCINQSEADDLNNVFSKNNSITQWCSLTSLNAGTQWLTSLPSSIWNLINLENLGLFNNSLTTLPPEIWNLTNLIQLELGYNSITILPPEIWNLTNLNYLGLDNTGLITLPPEIRYLTNLETLNFSLNTLLTTLPSEIWDLTNLTELTLNYNSLAKLPNELVNLINLTSLNLRDNIWLGNLSDLFDTTSSSKSQSNITPDWKTMTISWNWTNVVITVSE